MLDGASLEKPESGVFIRGRVQGRHALEKKVVYRVRYGIEAYFAPRDKALELERKLRDGGVAVIMVAKNGKVTLKEVIAKREERARQTAS